MPDEHDITIFVNNQPFKTAKHELTGAQIKALAGVPSEYELFRVEGQRSLPVQNDERVHLFLTPNEVVLSLREGSRPDTTMSAERAKFLPRRTSYQSNSAVLRMELVG